jgi:type III pantothenate kinase
VSEPPVLLTLDRGNSTLDCMLHDAEGRRERCDSDRSGVVAGFLRGARPTAAVGVSVVPAGLAAAERELAALGVPLRLVGRDLQCPLRLDYRTPATLGADRWLGALAAHRAHGAAVTIDCGSATTLNLIDADGTFRGGAIAPGLRAMAVGMAQRTPHLPAPVDAEAGEMPPRSSTAAVSAGVVLGWCGAIERLAADLQRAAAMPTALVLTGGEAGIYLQHGRLRPVHVPDLVHQGLRLLAAAACAC